MTRGDTHLPLPDAVLWDMDGTLVDTEPYWIAAEHAIVEEHGGTWNDEFAHHEVVADQRQGVLLAPGAPVHGRQRELGLDPVGLGVDEGAVHVPQDGRGQRHQSSGS